MISRLIALGVAGVLIAGAVTQATAHSRPAASAGLRFTFNPVVASVQLALRDPVIAAGARGATTQLLITARDPSGAVIVGPYPYVDRNGRPLLITISNSSPANTLIAPVAFSRALPGRGASNVATITYTGRAHFHYPTFAVTTPGLTSPAAQVTLQYGPGSGADFESSAPCIAAFPSVGGSFYGGPFFALSHDSRCPLPIDSDIWLKANSGPPYSTFNVNPNHDGVALGFGSDKNIYFAYNSAGSNTPAEFGYLRNLAARTSANISNIPTMTLGNDGSLWFGGIWNGQGTIGKLPPAAGTLLQPQLFSVPGADSIISVEPGIGNTEAFLFHAAGGVFIGTIGTNLNGFSSVLVLPNATDPGFGDLLAGPGNTFYASIPGSGTDGSVVKIASDGTVSSYCGSVQQVFRLADGTGVGYHTDVAPYHAIVHVVPGQGCTSVPVYPLEPFSPSPFFDLLGVDSTTPDWIFYSNPSGHRTGIF